MQQLEVDQAYFANLFRPTPGMTREKARSEMFTWGAFAVRGGLFALKPLRTLPIGLALSAAVSYAFTGNGTTAIGSALASDIVTASLVAAGIATGASVVAVAAGLTVAGFLSGGLLVKPSFRR